jgi:nitrite reductase/ring-hydroxylating ferredoxin subunit
MPDHEILPAYPDSAIPHVGTYRRVLPVSLERMYENTLDWEHLPFVHESSFKSIECRDAGSWGWRAAVADRRGGQSVIELRLDRGCRRWITRTLQGKNAGAEIWTHAFPIGERRVDIVVDFFVPGVPAAERDKVGNAYAKLYMQLYDEDVEMMVSRQQQLDRRVAVAGDSRVVELGERALLELPLRVEIGGRTFVLAEVAGELATYPALCPHQLGPLADAPVVDGVVTCPWHGYRFNVKTGDCTSGQSCRLGQLPQITLSNANVTLTATH